ncbi:MAG: polymer-forming cytoskeletal protein, partial [Spirochaetales bacterium]|nr:polymer-forming cytoskeletal protein [Spirochaetales bacterium]
LKIRGSFKGEIDSDGVLFVDKEAEVLGDVKAKEVIVSGKLTGDINASERIELLSGGEVKGDLNASRVRIAESVDFVGACKMIKDPETIDIFSASAEKLKEIALSV